MGDENPFSSRRGEADDVWAHMGIAAPPVPAPLQPPGRTSGLAITSLLSGLLSPVMLCLCPLSLLPSLVAIVTGHWAIRDIKRSGGAVQGYGLSFAGLAIGYPVLLVSLAWLGFLMGVVPGLQPRHEANEVVSSASLEAERHLKRALELIDEKGAKRGYGNGEEAQRLALRFADQIRRAHDDFATKRLLPVSKEPFVTYCALGNRQCAFVVLVPEYGKYDQESKDHLAQSAWLTAQEIAATILQPGDELAVALKGQFLFGSIHIGELAPKGGEFNSYAEGQQPDLLEFFDTPDAVLTPEMPPEQIDLGLDERPGDPFAPPM